LCPWMKLQHMGMYVFGGSLIDLAQIGAGATTDVHELKKKKIGAAATTDVVELKKKKK
jgi:hypothetical protein